MPPPQPTTNPATPNAANAAAAAAAQMMAQAMAKVGQQLQAYSQLLSSTTGMMTQQTTVSSRLADSQLAVGAAYAFAASKMTGLFRAGIAGTTTGEALGFQFQQLHRQLLSSFVPALETGISKLQQLNNWFRTLSGEQQAGIAKWTGFGVAMLGSVTLVPRLIGAFTTLGSVMQGAFLANPIVAFSTAIVGLMAQSEEGRDSLAKLGSAAMDAFQPLIDILMAAVIPTMEYFVQLLSTTGGQFAALAVIVTLVAVRVVTACRAMAMGFGSINMALGLLGILIMGLMNIGGGGALGKTFDDIAGQVRSGRKTLEDAKKEVTDLAIEQAHKEHTGGLLGGAIEGINKIRDENEEARRKQLEEEGMSRIDRAAKGKRDRSDLVTARTGTESDPKQTIRRIEDATLKTGMDPKRTADAAEGILDILKGLGFGGKGGKDNQENPQKAD